MAHALVLSLFAVMFLMCFSEVLTDGCVPYVDQNYRLVPYQQCGLLTACGGTCTNRYCIIGGNLDQSQFACLVNNLYVIIGGSILIFLLVVGGIVVSCLKCCYLTSLAFSSNSII